MISLGVEWIYSVDFGCEGEKLYGEGLYTQINSLARDIPKFSASLSIYRIWAATSSSRNSSGNSHLLSSKILGARVSITQRIYIFRRGEPGNVFSYMSSKSEISTIRVFFYLEIRALRSGRRSSETRRKSIRRKDLYSNYKSISSSSLS